MSEQFKIQKTVYSKEDLNKTLDRSFQNYTQESTNVTPVDLAKFFAEYERLYFDIPPLGDTASHYYLIIRSSELVNIDKDILNIQPLLDEIANLRERLLEAQVQYIEAQSTVATLTAQLATNSTGT